MARPTAKGLSVAVSACAAALAVGACTATVETAHPVVAADDEAVVTVETVPPDIYVHPHTEYRGRTVYYVDGRWYYPHDSRWYAYRAEPAELTRRRPYVQQAPPARPYVQQAPPAGPVYRAAPPEAVPVR
jgi:hypothetical protein